jgi:hypothetical protein
VLVGLGRHLVGEPALHVHPGGGAAENQSGHRGPIHQGLSSPPLRDSP